VCKMVVIDRLHSDGLFEYCKQQWTVIECTERLQVQAQRVDKCHFLTILSDLASSSAWYKI